MGGTPGYGTLGRVGIATPQANPTVEDEFRILLPPKLAFNVVRLRGSQDSRERLVDYARNLPESLATFDTLKPQLLGFACTGTSYLLGQSAARDRFAAVSAAVGYEIQSATTAIEWALDRIGARRIGLILPYPPWLADAARRYWEGAGLTVHSLVRIDTQSADTRSVYGVANDAVASALAGLDVEGVDAIVLSGTGMPTLQTLAHSRVGRPTFSSNVALAACMMDRLGLSRLLGQDLGIEGWRDRLSATLAMSTES